MVVIAVKCSGEKGLELQTVPVTPVTLSEHNQGLQILHWLNEFLEPFGESRGDGSKVSSVLWARRN